MSKLSILTLKLHEVSAQTLYAEIGEEPTVVFVTNAFSETVAKAMAISKELDYKIVWMVSEVQGMMRRGKRLLADTATILNAVNQRKNRRNVIFFMVHAITSYSTPYRIRQVMPDADFKVISFIYDFVNLLCPFEHRHLWHQYNLKGADEPGLLGGRKVEEEYESVAKLCRGEGIDALMYKDSGPDFPLLKESKALTSWQPPVLPTKLNVAPPSPSIGNRITYIGTLVPKVSHGREAGLFEDIMLADLFKEVSDQGFQIDCYCMKIHPLLAEEYDKKFPDRRVSLQHGKLVGQLLPTIQGRYRWGWMLYEFNQPVIMEHVKVTIPTKLFTYLALGVPILVSEEMEAAAKLISDWGIGVVFSRDEIKDVNRKLADVDYPQLLKNIEKARKHWCLEKHMGRFIDTIKEVMEK